MAVPRPEPSSPVLQKLRKRIGQAPTQPGVYRWLGKEGEILYVGKAKDLRQRLRSYVVPGAKLGPWKESLVRQVQDFDLTVVRTELEALVLETTLIKEHRPKYNVLMKDDKSYVYVRITADTYPRIDVVRRIEDDGAQYFGPKPAAWQVHEVLAILRKLHRFRTCKMSIEPVAGAPETIPLEVECTHRDRPVPCLDYHMEQCAAPCIGALTPAQYREQCIDPVARFWKGELEPVTQLLKQKMQEAAAGKQFEAAAQFRDQLQRITSLAEGQAVSDTSGDDVDAIGIALLTGRCQAVLYQKRSGKVTNEVALALSGQPESLAEALEQFLPLYYSDNVPPPLVLIPEEVASTATLEAWLTERAGRVVELRVPARGQKTQLLDLAMANAKQKVLQQEAKWEAEARNTQNAGEELQSLLTLPKAPKRIECYDISHLGGTETVGSMVVFENGKPKKEHYRSFTIQSLKTGDVDDYRSLQEVLRRRLRHLTGGTKGEVERWAKEGVVIRKAVKADQPELTRLRREIFDRETEPAMYKETVVAERGEKLVGIARLSVLGKGVPLLRSLAVAPEARGGKLGLTLARFLLAKTKHKKVYLSCEEFLQGFYGGAGFRHVIKPPEAVLEIDREYRKKYPDEPPMMLMVWNADEHKADASLQKKPDILLIDGGLGQLHAVERELERSGLADIALISLAKREEEVFTRGSSTPLVMAADSPAHILLRRLRDEAHRFANRHRESRATARMVASRLPDLPGIGPVTAQALLKKFGSLQGAQAATDEQLREILTAAQLKALRSA